MASEITDQKYEFQGETLETQYNVSSAAFQEKVSALENKLSTKKRIDPGRRNEETNRVWLEKAFSPTRDSTVFVSKTLFRLTAFRLIQKVIFMRRKRYSIPPAE
ncbi:MAG: hypothetical protein QJR04_04910 [Burkholderia multivorans]|nr:hypothetical protein [Burkholderia multivorans]